MNKKRSVILLFIFFMLNVVSIQLLIAQEKRDSITDGIEDYFSMSMEELMEQKVITASKEHEDVDDVPASVIIITREDIETYGYQSVTEILENTTGFYKHDDYKNTGFGVRGFFTNVYNRSFILLVNGIEQSSPYQAWNSFNLTTIQVEAIERIEIIKGPNAVMYGNNAFFGAINIITSQNENGSINQVTTSYGSDNTFRTNLQSSFKEDKLQVSVAAGLSTTEGRNVSFSPILDSVADYFGNYSTDVTTENFFKKDTKYINITGSYSNLYYGFSYDYSDRNVIHNITPIKEAEHTYTSSITRFTLGYKKQLTKTVLVDVNTQYHVNNVKQNYNRVSYNPKIEYGDLYTNSYKSITEGRIKYTPSDRLNVLLGAQFSTASGLGYINVPPVFNNHTNKVKNSILYGALFTQWSYKFNSKWQAVAGVRVDYQPKYFMQNTFNDASGNYQTVDYSYSYEKPIVAPKLAAIYKINTKNTLKLVFAQASSRPSIAENFFFYTNVHPVLLPQRISTVELNYNYSKSNRFTVNTSVYYNYLDKIIVRSTKFSNNVYSSEFTNSGVYTTLGTDIQLVYKHNYHWNLDVSCTLQKTEDLKDNQKAAYSPTALIYIKPSYRFNEHVSVAVMGNYVGAMESYWDETPSDVTLIDSAPVGRVNETTPGYFNLAANVRLENLFSKGIFMAFHAYNILNTRKRYAPTEVNYDYLPNGTYDQGIQLYINLGIKF